MIIKNQQEIEILREGGAILAQSLNLLASKIEPGVSAFDLDQIAEKNIRKLGGEPAFKNYKARMNDPPYPASLCVSVNDEVVHGLPAKEKILREGDIVGLDLGVIFKGLFTDAAITLSVGKVLEKHLQLIATTKRCLDLALDQIKPSARIGDLGFAMETEAKGHGFQTVRELVGHGVGLSLHEEPEIPCFGKPGTGPKIKLGHVLAVEPMVNEGDWRVGIGKDKFTVLTLDGSRSAHFEHTVLVTEDGYEILTNI
jgi:methionyl aminopeptidase